jgi:hypothetical protein
VAGHPLTRVVVLGATGSIGRQTLDVAGRLGIPIAGLAAGGLTDAIITLAHRYPDAAVAVARPPDGPIEAGLAHAKTMRDVFWWLFGTAQHERPVMGAEESRAMTWTANA